MPRKRAVILTIGVCLLAAAPAAASERSEARAYAAAMEPEIALTPAELEAFVAGIEARSAHIAATCLDAVKAAAANEDRRIDVAMLYGLHVSGEMYAVQAGWMRAADERLAAIRTSSRTLRRGRFARRALTRFIGRLPELVPADFCAVLTQWQATRYKGAPPGMRAMTDAMEDADKPYLDRWLNRAERALKRHGATRAQRSAFSGGATWPELRDPAPDPVMEALGLESADDAGRRTSSALGLGT